MLRVAVIGVGSMGKNHARIYFNKEETDLVAVADVNEENLLRVSKKYRAAPYRHYQELLAKEQIDAVSIAVPTNLHQSVARACLTAKKHVLLEKPIASREIEAQEIIEAARQNNVKLMIGHTERFNTAVLELKKRLEAGELGEIYKIDVQRIGPFPSRISDIGVIIDLAVHDLDIINYLFNARPVRVYAEIQKRLHPQHEDSVTALIRYENSSLAVLNVNYLSPTKTRIIKLFGKKGMFKVNYLAQELSFYENNSFSSDDWKSVTEGDMKKIKIFKKEPLEAEIEAFVRCCVNPYEQPPVTGEQALTALKTAQLILKSANEREIIER